MTFFSESTIAMSQVQIQFLPSLRCLFDEPVNVTVKGLVPDQQVDLRAEVTDDKEGVGRVPVKEERIRGTLFIPPGEGPFPGVLDLYTFGGGLSEIRPCLLANKGFLVLTVSLYGYDDLPKKVSMIDLEYFEDALMFLKKQPKLGNCGVGVLSLSKSGDLALSIASLLPDVSATVWINGCSANTMYPLHYKDIVIPPLMYDPQKTNPTKSGAIIIKGSMNDVTAEENKDTVIPIEKAKGKFLFVASQDDKMWDSCYYTEQAIKRLKSYGKQNYEVVTYPGAGHFLETPYIPFCHSSLHGVINKPVVWGGEPRNHAAAEVDLWKRIQLFFRYHLDESISSRKAKL
ncbi:hypothetical protein AGOR_G00106620 [Albula goreensis]|uniref:BAAT/Acyl-CoA thioester hydrolase C-terminal domain-containing protein n=1 Tax=Albula goreensis TaxID=1534307 RepID=A0A8T3DGJ1_9TELE|nr:hypothetical protein AGOR_G00106620 [Albula goreensis]